nr:integrase, catalytic region, zinc finger, CCHC-type, peptidase aspartic, catalytic [Tanacetum cinerariifolium]
MSRDVLTVGSTMRIPLLYRGEYSQWVKRFMNYIEEQMDGEAMINSIKNGDQPLPRVTQVSIAGTSSNEQPPLKDKSMWSDQEKKIQKIDRLARSLLIQGLPNDIYSLIDRNKTAKDLWDALARHMLGSEYVINDLKKCGYSKDNCELHFKFLNNLQPEWKQYATMMRQTKNLMDINIDALHNILKQNQGDVNDALGYKKKVVVVTSDPLALVAEKKNKITALLAKAFNQRKFYSKPTNNNLRTSSTSQSANKKQEFVKSDDKKVEKKDDEKKRDMSKDQAWIESSSDSDQEINANMVFMAQIEKKRIEKANQQNKDLKNQNKDLQEKYDVLINQVNTFEEQNNEFNEQIKVLNEKNGDLLAQTNVLQDQLKVKHVVIDTHIECQAQYAKLEEERYKYMIRYSALCDNDKQHRKKIDEQEILFDKMSRQLVEMNNNILRLQDKILEKETKISELKECVYNKDLEIEKRLERLNVCENKLHKKGQTNQAVHMIMPFKDILCNGRKGIALEIEKFKRARENKIEFAYDYGSLNACYVNEKINFSDDYFQEIINPDFEKIDSPFQQTSSLKTYVPTVILEKIIIDLEDEVIVQICLWIIDSGCSKHMTGNRALLINFMEKFFGTVHFGNNDFAVIAGYGDV